MVQGAEDLGALTEQEIRERQQAMQEAMLKQKQKAIMQQTEKSMHLPQENQGMLQLEEFGEAAQALRAMKERENKEKLRKQLEKQAAAFNNTVCVLHYFKNVFDWKNCSSFFFFFVFF